MYEHDNDRQLTMTKTMTIISSSILNYAIPSFSSVIVGTVLIGGGFNFYVTPIVNFHAITIQRILCKTESFVAVS